MLTNAKRPRQTSQTSHKTQRLFTHRKTSNNQQSLVRHISEDECNMRLIRNSKAISGLSLILLILASAIGGALLSYMWVVGYYEKLKIRTPEKSDATITNATFLPRDTSFFNVTIFNPSYSPSDAVITRIAALTEDDLIHNVNTTDPLPYPLPKATTDFPGLQTFECSWDWANYTGEKVGIMAFLADGSGPTFETETPLVDLRIADVSFNPAISATHFNVTVQNYISPASSNVTVDITEISVTVEGGFKPSITEIIPALPWSLSLGGSSNFMCTWDWTEYQNMSVTVAVYTSQGYMDYTTKKTPAPVTLEITDILFDVTNTTSFDVTVRNNQISPTYLNVTKIGVIVGNQKIREWTTENGTAVNPHIPFTLNKSSTQNFVCPWNWTEYRGENVTVVVCTLQGFTANYTRATPTPVILDFTEINFDPIDTRHFNFTVQNSEFSLMGTNITEVFVTVENEIVANLTDYLGLPIQLSRAQSVDLLCPWDWGEYVGRNVTVVVENQLGYFFHSEPITLVALTISDVTFNPIESDYFIFSVQNPTLLDLTLTTINVAVDAISSDITPNVVPPFSFSLPTATNYTFICLWENWTDNQGKEATITIETLRGYEASYTCRIPSVS